MEFFIFNGKYYPAKSAVITADNRGLRFGDGLFETMKAINGDVQFIDEHLARLWTGLQVLQFDIPKLFTPDLLQSEILNLLKKNGLGKKARIRLTVFRGDGGIFDGMDQAPGYLIQSWALPAETGDWNSNGQVLGIYPNLKKNFDILANLKHNNFLPYALAAQHAKKEKWNDALLLNTEGRLCDTCIANIFLVKNGRVYTPLLSEGCVAGVMRKQIIEQLTGNGNKPVETELSVNDLLTADEVFLSNSIYNMRWVQSFGDKKYTADRSFKIYTDLFSTNS